MHLASTKPLSNKALCHQSLGMHWATTGPIEAPKCSPSISFVTMLQVQDCIQQKNIEKQCFRCHQRRSCFCIVIKPNFLETFPERPSKNPYTVVGSHAHTSRTIWQISRYTHLSPAYTLIHQRGCASQLEAHQV